MSTIQLIPSFFGNTGLNNGNQYLTYNHDRMNTVVFITELSCALVIKLYRFLHLEFILFFSSYSLDLYGDVALRL